MCSKEYYVEIPGLLPILDKVIKDTLTLAKLVAKNLGK
jgi:hypothetical protein